MENKIFPAELNVQYDIDDVDGHMYMLAHEFSGCIVTEPLVSLKEGVGGIVSYQGEEVGRCVVKAIAEGGRALVGIPLRHILKEYDADYEIQVKGLEDVEGNVMAPQNIKIHTNSKGNPDERYAAHDAVALQAAEEGIVLLKNEGRLLPLRKDCPIVVKGMEDFRVTAVGAGRINPRYMYRLERAIAECSNFVLDDGAETGILVISRGSGENYDNNALPGEYYLTEEERRSISEIREQCKSVIAVINSGYPMDARWIEEFHIDAAIWCGFSGMLGEKR